MCPHCIAVGAVALVTGLPFVKPTINHYRAKKRAKKEREDATDREE